MSWAGLVFCCLVLAAVLAAAEALLRGMRSAVVFNWLSGAGSRTAGAFRKEALLSLGRKALSAAGELQEKIPGAALASECVNRPVRRWLGEDDPGSAFLLAVREVLFVSAAVFFTWLLSDWLLGVACGVTTAFVPDILARRRHRMRAEAIARELPDVLDLLVISLESGLGLDSAFQGVAQHLAGGPVSSAIARMQGEVRFGAPRHQAWRRMAERLGSAEVLEAVSSLVTADSMGVSLKEALGGISSSIRAKRRLSAEEAAHKAPVKMLFPLAIFIFPAIFLVLLGPVFLQLMETLGG